MDLEFSNPDDFLVSYAKTYAFETTLAVPCNNPICDQYMDCCDGHEKYFAIAVNIGHTNSKVFDVVWRRECPWCSGNDESGLLRGARSVCTECHGTGYIEPYDLMITFVRRKDKLWNVSLYSTKPEIDCGEIAKSFGGGGHKGAAGFQCEELPFEI